MAQPTYVEQKSGAQASANRYSTLYWIPSRQPSSTTASDGWSGVNINSKGYKGVGIFCTMQEMADVHIAAWKKGLKSLYYCRAKAAGKVSVGTGGDTPLNSIQVRQKIEWAGECLSCEG